MFESIFTSPCAIARHRDGPLAFKREEFLRHLAQQGYSRKTMRSIAAELIVVAQRMEIGEAKISIGEIEVASESWARDQRDGNHACSLCCPAKLFKRTAITWLDFLGLLSRPLEKTSRTSEPINQFEAYMRDDRGLSSVTIYHCGWHAKEFIDYLSAVGQSLKTVRVDHLDAYVAQKSMGGWNRSSLLTMTNSLRSFLRYAGLHGWCASDIAAAIDVPRLYKQERLAQGLDWQDVQKLIASSGGQSRRDVRDRAILMLLSIYGLRCGEVSILRLDDLNWDADLLQVRRKKQRRAQEFPLEAATGGAIFNYLQTVRPRSEFREIFLTLNAPFRPLSHGSIYNVVRSRLDVLNLTTTKRGPHCLRHACANYLLRCGFSLKQIGDHLGHRSADATRIYAKVDVCALRQVAEIDLRGLL